MNEAANRLIYGYKLPSEKIPIATTVIVLGVITFFIVEMVTE